MIKLFFFIQCTFITTYFCYAQKNMDSFYFKSPQPNHIEEINSFHETIHGCYYKNTDSLIQVCISSDSIYTKYSIILTIPKINLKNKGYSIEDSLLHGIKDKKGIPFREINDTLYGILQQTSLFFKIDSNSVLKVDNGNYYLNELQQEKYYSTIEISKNKEKLFIKECDHQQKEFPNKDLNINEIMEKNQQILLANPNEMNWINFIKNNGFNEQTLYHQ